MMILSGSLPEKAINGTFFVLCIQLFGVIGYVSFTINYKKG